MVAPACPIDSLLASLAEADVRLTLRGVRLVIDAPEGAVTPSLAAGIREHRCELMHAVRVAGPCYRCGSTEFVDVAIHDDQSARRDCKRCGRTWGFPRWHSAPCGDA